MAFKIFLELSSRENFTWQQAYERSVFFIQLLYYGYSDDFMIDNETDLAPLKLKQHLEQRKSRNLSLMDIKTFKIYVLSGHQFMNYKVHKHLRLDRQHSVDPFPSVDSYEATNDLHTEPLQPNLLEQTNNPEN